MIDINYIQRKYGFNFKYSLGQNFLSNDLIVNSIIENSDISNEDIILEIGPGFGVLTDMILNKAKHVISVELDNDAIEILNKEFEARKNFTLIHNDFLKLNLSDIDIIKNSKNIKVIGNIPYYITTPILVKLFESEIDISSIILMVQKEVGQRINAQPSTKQYGSLTIFSKYYSNTSIIEKVSAENFIPKPKVDSVVVKFDIKKERLFIDKKIEKDFLNYVKTCFNMRRKTLFNVLKQFDKSREELEKISNEISIDFNRRCETLVIEEFKKIFESIYK